VTRLSVPRVQAAKAMREGRLGDLVAAMLKAAGIQECDGCTKRKDTLNRIGQDAAKLLRGRNR